MAHEIAKILLEQGKTLPDRGRAVEAALKLGMPLHEIESYLDWLDLIRASDPRTGPTNGSGPDLKRP